MLTDKSGNRVTVRYAAVAALVRWNDGKHTLIGNDGFTIMLDAAEWRDGTNVVAGILRHVPRDLVVPVDEPGPRRPSGHRARLAVAGASRPDPPTATGSDASAPRSLCATRGQGA